jgi:hypothetical protein
MIKRYLLAAVFVAFSFGFSNAQCVPNPIYADSSFNIWPDTITNLPCAFADNSGGYEAVINLKTLADTTINVTGFGDVTAYISAFRVNGVTGLPAGFSYASNQTPWNNGGTSPNFTPVQGCMSVLANQTALQTIIASNPDGADFPLIVTVDAKISSTNNAFANFVLSNRWLSEVTTIPGVQPIPVIGYVIKVRPSEVGGCVPLATIAIDLQSTEFEVQGNFPNPFTGTTEIRFTNANRSDVEFEVRNMVGKQILSRTIKAERGQNNISFNADKFIPGIYFYTINDGKKSITRKMIVSAN